MCGSPLVCPGEITFAHHTWRILTDQNQDKGITKIIKRFEEMPCEDRLKEIEMRKHSLPLKKNTIKKMIFFIPTETKLINNKYSYNYLAFV